MSVTKLEEAKKQAALEQGSNIFFRAHRDLWACEANNSILAAQVLLKFPTALEALASWEAAYQDVKGQLAAEPEEKIALPEQKWPYPWMPEVHTAADVRRIPRKVFTDLYYDKNGKGELTERAKTFRAVVNALLGE